MQGIFFAPLQCIKKKYTIQDTETNNVLAYACPLLDIQKTKWWKKKSNTLDTDSHSWLSDMGEIARPDSIGVCSLSLVDVDAADDLYEHERVFQVRHARGTKAVQGIFNIEHLIIRQAGTSGWCVLNLTEPQDDRVVVSYPL